MVILSDILLLIEIGELQVTPVFDEYRAHDYLPPGVSGISNLASHSQAHKRLLVQYHAFDLFFVLIGHHFITRE